MNFNRNVVQVTETEVKRLDTEYGQVPETLIIEAMQQKGIAEIDTKIALKFLTKKGAIVKNNDYYKFRGDIMNEKPIQTQAHSGRTNLNANLNCTEEQKNFARLVMSHRKDIFDAMEEGVTFTHRGAQVAFGGCGKKAFKYKMAIGGFSDKEPVEIKDFWLDWDDSALYDEGGLADQIRELLGAKKETSIPTLEPAVTAQVGK